MAIANRTCVSFCNQPKAHYLATSRESRRYVIAFSRIAGGSIWLRQESLRHILASPGYIDGKRIQCLSNAPQHVSSVTNWPWLWPTDHDFDQLVKSLTFSPLAMSQHLGVSVLRPTTHHPTDELLKQRRRLRNKQRKSTSMSTHTDTDRYTQTYS